MKLRYDFVVQNVSDGYVAVAVGDDATKFSGIIRMNETGAFIFEQLKKETTLDEITAALTETYAGDEANLRVAAERFIDHLCEEQVLIG